MAGDTQQPAPAERGPQRYEATIHPGDAGDADLARVADFDLDRIPDPEGTVRVLVDLEAAEELVRRGYEVRLHRAVPVQPLDQRLIAQDDDVRAWFDERIRPTGQGEAP
jgi:hypothetical protein